MRQIHHWAALLFLAAIVVHLARVFFTGAFRRPREINWIIGVTLLILAMVNGFAGYSLLDDQLSGTGPAHRLLDRAVDPGHRHVDGVAAVRRRVPRARHHPAALRHPHPDHPGGHRGCCSAPTSAILVRHKHTQFPGPGRREDNVVGERLWPTLRGQGARPVLPDRRGAVPSSAAWSRSTRSGSTARSTRPRSRGVAARLVHGLARRRAAVLPGWEIRAFGFEIPNPFFPGVLLPAIVRAALRLAVPRGAGHRRPRRAPPPRPAPRRAAAHRHRCATFMFYPSSSWPSAPTCCRASWVWRPRR